MSHVIAVLIQRAVFLAFSWKLAYWECVLARALTSSHLDPYCEQNVHRGVRRFQRASPAKLAKARKQARDLKNTYLPDLEILAQGGFVLMDPVFGMGDSLRVSPRPGNRIRQYKKARESILESKERVGLLVMGTNDFKHFLVKNGKWLGLGQGAVKKWEKLTLSQQVNFSRNKSGDVVCKETRLHIESQVQNYIRQLLVLLQGCSFECILHSSLLERDWDACGVRNLDIFFAHINAYLKKALSKLNETEGFRNKFGNPVRFEYVNVSHQFFLAKREGKLDSIFRESRFHVYGRTHRSQDALNEIASIYSKEVDRAWKALK